jgi:hypothetical protein
MRAGTRHPGPRARLYFQKQPTVPNTMEPQEHYTHSEYAHQKKMKDKLSALRRGRYVVGKKDASEIVKLSQISQTPVIFMYLKHCNRILASELALCDDLRGEARNTTAANIRGPTRSSILSSGSEFEMPTFRNIVCSIFIGGQV